MVFGKTLRKKTVKKKLLDTARTQAEKDALYQYAPSTLSTMHKQLFSEFCRNGIAYSQQDFSTCKHGSYHAYWRNEMAVTAKVLPNYGKLTHHSAYDPEEDFKLRNNAQPPWNFDDFNDLLLLFVWQVMTCFMLRDRHEVSYFKLFLFSFNSTCNLTLSPACRTPQNRFFYWNCT